MFKRNGKPVVWPWLSIACIVLSFAPWIGDKLGYEPHASLNIHMSDPVMNYLFLTWLPTLGNVLIVATLLAWFGAPMVSNMLRERKSNLERAIDEASRVKSDAQIEYQDAVEKLERLDEEMRDMRASYARSIEEEKARIAEETSRQEARIAADAESVFELPSSVEQRKFEREIMLNALEKARAEIAQKVNSDAALRDRLIDQGIASLRINV